MFVFISVVIGAFGGALLDFIPMGAASGAVIGAIIDSVLHPR
jgi:H+/Cl- antiporter ClcA